MNNLLNFHGVRNDLIFISETTARYVQHIFAMTTFENKLYWTDWEFNDVMRADKYTGDDVQTIYNANVRPMDIHIHHPFRQLPSNYLC